MITEHEEHLLRHMLGADSRYPKKQWGYRNHFCADEAPQCPDRLAFEKMEKKGLVKSGERIGNTTFWATKAGAIAIGFKPYQLKKTKLAA